MLTYCKALLLLSSSHHSPMAQELMMEQYAHAEFERNLTKRAERDANHSHKMDMLS